MLDKYENVLLGIHVVALTVYPCIYFDVPVYLPYLMIEISLCHSGGAAPLAELENDDIDQKSLKQRKSPSKSSKLRYTGKISKI